MGRKRIAARFGALSWLSAIMFLGVLAASAGRAGAIVPLYIAGSGAAAACGFVYAGALARLVSLARCYRGAAIFIGLGCLAAALAAAAQLSSEAAAMGRALRLYAAAMFLVGEYCEFTAHAAALGGVSERLAALARVLRWVYAAALAVFAAAGFTSAVWDAVAAGAALLIAEGARFTLLRSAARRLRG